MSKGLEALKDLRTFTKCMKTNTSFPKVIIEEQCYDIIEKALKEHEQYKAIEQELGIDLPTLIKAMKDGVYVIDVYGSIAFEEPMICFNQELKTNLYILESVCHMPPDNLCKSSNYYLKDYGKTWALTKEELEK